MDKLRAILETELSEDRKKLAYEYSDGSRGYREVGEAAGVPAPTVQAWWARWLAMGIMERSMTRTGRVQNICSLRDIGIDVP
jgi:RimJ/RimL family protein N-acetyltransferase